MLFFFMKLGWGLLSKLNYLWVQVVKSKYKVPNVFLPHLVKPRTFSNLGKGIYEVSEFVENSVVWDIGCGRTVNF